MSALSDFRLGDACNQAREELDDTVAWLDAAADVATSEDEQNVQARKLHLRKARFRGGVLPARHITPVVNTQRLKLNEYDSPDSLDTSPLVPEPLHYYRARRASADLAVLQEISNSSLRRKAKAKPGVNLSTLLATDASSMETISTGEIYSRTESENHNPLSRSVPFQRIQPASAYHTASASSCLEVPNTIGRRSGKAKMARKISTGETSRYIEHLESQLAALQTQLTSLSSPSSTKSQSAKLRALNSETRALREEVADWEKKFQERIRDRDKEHELVEDNLKSQIRSLQKELTDSNEKLRQLELESVERVRKSEVAENANYDLERRLEFMSELLAHSPNKLDLHSDETLNALKRPTSMAPPRLPSSDSLVSPCRSRQAHRERLSRGTPSTPAPQDSTVVWGESPIPRTTPRHRRIMSADLETGSESTLTDSADFSPRRPRSMLLYPQSPSKGQDGNERPTRRMRRFYTGSMGPKSLILPSTNSTSCLPTSASVTTPPTPTLQGHSSVEGRANFVTAVHNLVEADNIPNLQLPLKWDEDEPSGGFEHNFVSHVSHSTIPTSARLSTSETTHDDLTNSSAQRALHRLSSLGSVQGRNLFEELSQMKDDSDANNKPSPAIKHMGSPIGSTNSGETRSPAPVSPPELHHDQETIPLLSHRSTILSSSARPTSYLDHLLSLISRSLDTAAPSACRVFTNAWSTAVLSRPVLALRWWLVRLLLGDLQKKGHALHVSSAGLGLSPSCLTSPAALLRPGLGRTGTGPRRVESVEAQLLTDLENGILGVGHLDEFMAGSGEAMANARGAEGGVSNGRKSRGATWLKFSVTLVLAFGIAIRDGPGVLFACGEA